MRSGGSGRQDWAIWAALGGGGVAFCPLSLAPRATSGSRTKRRVRTARSNKPKSWTFFPSPTSWAALWHSLLSVRHCQPWTPLGLTSCRETPKPKTGLSLRRTLFPRHTSEVCTPAVLHQFSFLSPLAPAWCLRREGVSSVLLGVSSAEQLIEHLGAVQVSRGLRGRAHLCPLPQQSGPRCPTRYGPGSSTTTEAPLCRGEAPEGHRARQGRG